jgi:hypothetical protein
MGQFHDIAGQRFGRLVAVRRESIVSGKASKWIFRCDCGNQKAIVMTYVRRGESQSCGCIRREDISRRAKTMNRKHGMSRSTTWGSWTAMKGRCLRKKHHAYARYGGRGIKICERWNNFENFLADMGERPLGTTLDRINADGNYEPKNCRWADWKTQGSSRRNVRFLTYKGKTKHILDWSMELGVSHALITGRLKRGLTVEQAFELPKNEFRYGGDWQRHRKATVWLEMDGRRQPRSYWAKEYGVSPTTITRRMARGMTLKEALEKK